MVSSCGGGVESGGGGGGELGSAAIKASTGPGCSIPTPPSVPPPPSPWGGVARRGGGGGGGGSAGAGAGRGRLGLGPSEAGDEVVSRVRDERRVRPRGSESAAWEAMAKANSRLRPARTPERSTKEEEAPPPPPSGSSSMVDPSAVAIFNKRNGSSDRCKSCSDRWMD
jgi:hypothetical protein